MSKQTKTLGNHAILLVLLSPFFFLYGLYILWSAGAWVVRALSGARRALSETIHCSNGHPNATIGRFECAVCRASYHGWVGRCGVCGAGAGWMPCSTCGVGISLPWELS